MLTRIILSGASGRMGQALARCIAARDDCTVTAGLDIADDFSGEFPIYADPADCREEADVLIDFSHPAALPKVTAFVKARRLPVVIATTGYKEEQIADIRALAKTAPVFFSANMSIGVNLLSALVTKAAAVLGDSFDIEIVEKHHNQKLDAPSGTALMLADAAKEGLSFTPEYVYERHSVRRKREKKEIGISAVRAGTIVGEHDVIFGGQDEVITLSHLAMSRDIFANGAVQAALFLNGKANSLYSMKDMLD